MTNDPITAKPAKQILLVDDDPTFSAVLDRALTRRGFKVRCANDIDQAREAAEACAPDYAVVDLKLGAQSGLKLIPLLKERRPAIRILMLTGYSSIATAVEAMRLGAFNYLCKPVGSDEIIAALHNDRADPDLAIATQPTSVDRLEWEQIQRVLHENDNNISATARSLNMHRRTLQRKLAKRPVRA